MLVLKFTFFHSTLDFGKNIFLEFFFGLNFDSQPSDSIDFFLHF